MHATSSVTIESMSLRRLPAPIRRLLLAFLALAAVGFGLGVGFVDHTTASHPAGIAERFRGSEDMGVVLDDLPPGREMQYEKSRSEMLNVTHTHILALGMLFLLTGAIFSFASGIPPVLKSFLVVEPFVSLLLTFGGMWLLRYHSPAWSWVIAASGVLMTVCFYTMVIVSAWQLLWRGREE